MIAADWSTIASFATALGTLVLAVATFAAVRSANKAARVSEAAYQVILRPVLIPSRMQDPMQKVCWMDNHWAALEGGQAVAEVVEDAVYVAISLRNVGNGIAVPFGWTSRDGLRRAKCPTPSLMSSPRSSAISTSHRRHRFLAGGDPRPSRSGA
jgi:hypothetical protein